MNNKTLLAIGLAVAAFTIFAPSRRYILPDGTTADESELPALGFVLYQGNWYQAKHLNAVMNDNRSAFDWQSLIDEGTALFKNGKSAWSEILRLFGKDATLPAADANNDELDAIDADGD